MDAFRRLKVVFSAATQPIEDNPNLEKFDETISPNMRALRLSMSVAELLIAMGVSVADVVSMALDITDRYCKRKVQFDISSTLITASQDRGDDREPLTMVRHAQPRSSNNMTVQSIQELVRDVHAGSVQLKEAEERLEEIVHSPARYPYWLTVAGGALISAGVGIIYGAKPIIILIMFLLGAIVTYVLRLLVHWRVPLFFAQIFAAIIITLVAAGITKLNASETFTLITEVNPTLIVIGGIVLLVSGLAIVGAVQDAIDEFYVTANARLLKVVMMTIGIVAGVLIGLYLAKKMGIFIAFETGLKTANSTLSLTGAMVISIGYALSTQSRIFSIIASGLMGLLAALVYSMLLGPEPLAVIVASGIAAAAVGFASTMISRWWRSPSTALMTAGIIPLVPGLALYNGLFQLVGNANNTATFDQGVLALFNALLIALAIASGVSFGHLLARPIRRTVVRARNALPQPHYVKE